MSALQIGVLGARSMIARLALFDAIDQSDHVELVAVSAASGSVPASVNHLDAGTYGALIEHPDVEAVYIPLPNHLHRPWAVTAMEAGKHVLCEKPLGRYASEAREMFDVAASTSTVLAEAWMTPFDPRWSTAVSLAASGDIGELQSISGSFTFTIGPEAAGNYRWDPDKGGGALSDVGAYCLGAIQALWGLSPDRLEASIAWSEIQDGASEPVDATTAATLSWSDGRVASIRCSFVEPEQQRLEIVGTTGTLIVDGDAFTGGSHATDLEIRRGGISSTVTVTPDNLYRRMVDSFAHAVGGREPWPRSAAETIAMHQMVDQIKMRANGIS